MISFLVGLSLSAKAKLINIAVTSLIIVLFLVLLFSHQQDAEQQLQHQSLMISGGLAATFHGKQSVIDNEVELLRNNEALMDRLLQAELENNASTLPLPKQLLDQLNHDLFLLYDVKGVLVARHGLLHQEIPANLRNKPLRGYLPAKEGLMFVVQAPVIYGKEIMGYVTLGDLMNKNSLLALLQARGDNAAIRLFVNHSELLTTDFTFTFDAAEQIALGTELNSGQDVTFTVGLDNQAMRSANFMFIIWLGLSLLFGVSIWWFLYGRLIGDIVIRLNSMKEDLGKLQIGDVYPAPRQVADAIDMVGRSLHSMSRRLQMKTEKLQLERQTLLTITNAAPIWIWKTDDAGRLIFTNKLMRNMLHLKKPEGRFLDELIMLETGGESSDLPDLNEDSEAVCKVRVGEFVHDMHVIIVKQLSESGKLIGMIGLAVDMTEQHRLETQYRHAQKMESLGSLVGGIAHNFNNLLAGMLGHLYLARSKANTQPEILPHLDKMEHASSRAADMVKQLLAFAHKGMDKKEVIDLCSIIESAFAMIKPGLPPDIDFDVSLCDENMCVYANDSALQQVFVNLLVNARDAMTTASNRQVRVKLERCAADDVMKKAHPGLGVEQVACLSVEDHGCGIDEANLKQVFDPFFTTKEVGKGTGLGLSMSLGTVESHGGWIEVDSIVDKGTVFRVYLPLTGELQKLVNSSQEPQYAGHGEQILLVDDELVLLEVGKEILESLGYRVLVANNGVDALALFKQHVSEIDLVISDVVMPLMGGIELCEQIKTSNAKMPVILISGYHKDGLGLDDASVSCDGVLGKPYHVESVRRLLSQLLSVDQDKMK